MIPPHNIQARCLSDTRVEADQLIQKTLDDRAQRLTSLIEPRPISPVSCNVTYHWQLRNLVVFVMSSGTDHAACSAGTELMTLVHLWYRSWYKQLGMPSHISDYLPYPVMFFHRHCYYFVLEAVVRNMRIDQIRSGLKPYGLV